MYLPVGPIQSSSNAIKKKHTKQDKEQRKKKRKQKYKDPKKILMKTQRVFKSFFFHLKKLFIKK